MCTGCGEMFDKRTLVRVVKSPEGEVSLDLTGKKAGRGAYVCKNADCLKKARKKRAFERAFSIQIDDSVYDKMEEEIKNASKKYLSMLGMARRAGKLSMGHDMALKAIKNHKAKLLIFASDVSPRLINEFNTQTERYSKNIICCNIEETINELYAALGYKAGVITVDDANFSNRITQLIASNE